MKAFPTTRLTQISFYSGFPVLTAVHSFIHSLIHFNTQSIPTLGQAWGTETQNGPCH